jgi:hypothetical protein
MKLLIILGHVSQLIAAILALFYFSKYESSTLKFFLFYLWYVILNELSAYFLLSSGNIRFELTNIYGFITPLYVIWTCKTFLASYKSRNILTTFIVVVCILNLTEWAIKGIHNEPWTVSKITGPLLCVASFTIYLTGLFKLQTVINPFKDIFTYFLLGFTLFSVASPIILLGRIFYLDNYSMSVNLSYIMGTVVILMYIIFGFGFYWGDKIEPQSSTKPE